MGTVIVLEHGRIVETGTPEELLQRCGRYWRLHRAATEVEKPDARCLAPMCR